LATSGDRYLATSGDFPMARDNSRTVSRARDLPRAGDNQPLAETVGSRGYPVATATSDE